jgi:hypothetical protein
MPHCSTCDGNRHKECFSKVQLRKPTVSRRCKSCIEGEAARLSKRDQLAIFQERTDRLLSPDRIHGVPEDLREPALLRYHILRVLAVTDRTAWLVLPLIKGLLEFHSSIPMSGSHRTHRRLILLLFSRLSVSGSFSIVVVDGREETRLCLWC